MMVGVCCVHQRAPGARSTKPTASFRWPVGPWAGNRCAGERVGGPRASVWPGYLKQHPPQNKQEASQAPSSLQS